MTVYAAVVQPTVSDSDTSGTQGPTGTSAATPAIAMLVAILTIMGAVAAEAWWSTALALVIEIAMLGIVVSYVRRVTTLMRATDEADSTLGSNESLQEAFSAHDVPVGSPERGAVRRAHQLSHPVAAA